MDWDRSAPMSMANRLAMLVEMVAGLTFVVVAVGLAGRCSDAVASLLFG